MCEDIELYSRLFVHSALDFVEVKSEIARAAGDAVLVSSRILTDLMYINVMRWDLYDEGRVAEHRGFMHYRYSCEVHPVHEMIEDAPIVDQEQYCESVCDLIKQLRNNGMLVAIECDFHDLVVERTGWNWNEKTPVHP